MDYIKGFSDRKYGLLGEHLSHSFSPQIHASMADYPYDLYEVERENLGSWVKSCGLSGYNVTIPYKHEIIKYCDTLSPAAQKIGAVNTVKVLSDGSLLGDNTDYYGFRYMVEALNLDLRGKKAIVLGNGGASKTVQVVLSEEGAEVVVFDLAGENRYSDLGLHTDAVLIVNATPVGMYPNTGVSLADLSMFTECKGVLDLIYNPAHTALLQQAEHLGIPCMNGLSMLVAQAKRACEIFTDITLSDSVIESIRRDVSAQTENLILVGMPGCGKTTIGTLLAQKLGRKFMDADEEILSSTGRTPSRIIKEDGEAAFRLVESQVLRDICKQSGLIIATGGGAVTVSENYDVLRQNGKVIFLQRNIDILATDDRPLSVNLPQLYEKRLPMYREFSHAEVDGNCTPEEAAERVYRAFSEAIV
ncbi:MAG: AAA family ATPase [Ruminococcus sp.]|nr:AAA family ATPase [Ruminococcus sp.]